MKNICTTKVPKLKSHQQSRTLDTFIIIENSFFSPFKVFCFLDSTDGIKIFSALKAYMEVPHPRSETVFKIDIEGIFFFYFFVLFMTEIKYPNVVVYLFVLHCPNFYIYKMYLFCVIRNKKKEEEEFTISKCIACTKRCFV